MNQVKLKDVAELAGVSIATVSMVLSGKGKISVDVSKNVVAAAKKLGYRRKIKAAGKGTGYIAILHYEPFEYLWNFIRPFIFVLEEILIQQGYFPVIFDMNRNTKTEEILKRVISSGACAVISIHYGNEELFTRLEDMKIPVVIINNSNFQDRFSSICVDDFQGAYEGAMHLIKLGHKKINYIEYFRPYMPSIIEDRFIGFKKAMDEHNINFSENLRSTVELEDMENTKPIIDTIFSGDKPPTAIFFHDDYLAAIIKCMLDDLGVKIPEQLSIIAPGDVLDYNQPFLPRITTMSINTELMAQIAGDLMMNKLASESQDIQVLKVKQQLKERGSCRNIIPS